jgi:hypothetical protein
MTGSKTWEREGIFLIEGVLDDRSFNDLKTEAMALHPSAIERGIDHIINRRDGSFASPSRFAVHSGGDALGRLLKSRDLLEVVRARSGIGRLVPVRCGYNYYRHGDFMGVHRDEVRATVTLTFGLTSNLGFTAYLPELRRGGNKELLSFVQERGSLPVNGSEMPIRDRMINAFDGYNIPHWRMPFQYDLGILANMIYFEL